MRSRRSAGCRLTFKEFPVVAASKLNKMITCYNVDLGLIGWAEAWELQKRLVQARKAGRIDDVLLLCEHPHVITLGRNGKSENLLASEQVLRQKGVAVSWPPTGAETLLITGRGRWWVTRF